MTSEPMTAPLAQRVGAAVAAGLVGVLVGLAGAIVHRHALRPDRPEGLVLPWGLVLTLAAAFAVTVAAGRLAGGPGAVGLAVGWAVTLLWLQPGRPEGDQVFLGDFLGTAYVLGGMATIALAVVRGMTVPPPESSPS